MILKQFNNDLTSLREKNGKLVEKEKIIEYYTKNIKLYSLNTNNKSIVNKLSDIINTIQQIKDKSAIPDEHTTVTPCSSLNDN